MIKLGNKTIKKNGLSKPYMIAEIGVNFYDIALLRDIDLLDAAKLMIDEAKRAKCDAVKFQIYKSTGIASEYAKPIWDTKIISETSQIKLYEKYDKFNKHEYEELNDYAKRKNIQFLASVFDEHLVDEMDFLDVYKIASLDLTNYILIKKIAKKGKPVIISTGASRTEEMLRAVRWIEEEKNTDIIPLHCILSYPTKMTEANLGYIKVLDRIFKYPVGYSCHVKPRGGMQHLIVAWLVGAKVIEKHFTMDKSIEGNDHYHAFDVNDGISFNKSVEKILELYGNDDSREVIESEKRGRKNGRRCLFAKENIKKGDVISLDNITAKRSAGVGIDSSITEFILGKKTRRDLLKGQPLFFECVDMLEHGV